MITEKEIINFIESEYWKSNLQSDSNTNYEYKIV